MNNKLEHNITAGWVLKFTLPSIIMMVVMSLYTVVDGTFVSRLIGTDAFSAVNIVYPLSGVCIGLGTMFGTGLTAIVSLKLGQGKQKEANQTLTFVMGVVVVVGLVLTALGAFFLPQLVRFLGASEAVFAYCYDYALPLVLFTTPCILQLVFQSLYVAAGRPGLGLGTTILGGIFNILLDYLFIAKLGMGIAGAAVATGIGYALPTLVGLYFFACNRQGTLHFVRPKAMWRSVAHAMANGSSEMVSNLSTSVTTFLFNILMMRYLGQDGVAAIAILLYLDFVLVAVSLGYSIGVAPLFSYNHGRGDGRRVAKLFRLSVLLCGGTGLVMTGATVLFAGPLAGVFAPAHSPVYALAVEGLKIFALSYLFKGFSVFCSAMFTAFGNGVVSALLSCMRTLVFLVGSLLGLAVLLGVTGVWWATPAAETMAFCMALAFVAVYHRRYALWGRVSK